MRSRLDGRQVASGDHMPLAQDVAPVEYDQEVERQGEIGRTRWLALQCGCLLMQQCDFLCEALDLEAAALVERLVLALEAESRACGPLLRMCVLARARGKKVVFSSVRMRKGAGCVTLELLDSHRKGLLQAVMLILHETHRALGVAHLRVGNVRARGKAHAEYADRDGVVCV